MILSNKEIIALKNPKNVNGKERSTLMSRAMEKINKLNSEPVKEELSVIAKNMECFNLLEIINVLVNELPAHLAKDHFTERNEHIDKSMSWALGHGKELKNITEEVRYVAKGLKTKEFLRFGEISSLFYMKDKSDRIREIKRMYKKDINFVLSRKLSIDEEVIKINFVKTIIFKTARELKHFTLEKLLIRIIVNIKKAKNKPKKIRKFGKSTLKKLVYPFIELGIIQKRDFSENEFIQKVREKILLGDCKPLTTENSKIKQKRFTKKFEIYPYSINKLDDKEELKINPYYTNLEKNI